MTYLVCARLEASLIQAWKKFEIFIELKLLYLLSITTTLQSNSESQNKPTDLNISYNHKMATTQMTSTQIVNALVAAREMELLRKVSDKFSIDMDDLMKILPQGTTSADSIKVSKAVGRLCANANEVGVGGFMPQCRSKIGVKKTIEPICKPCKVPASNRCLGCTWGKGTYPQCTRKRSGFEGENDDYCRTHAKQLKQQGFLTNGSIYEPCEKAIAAGITAQPNAESHSSQASSSELIIEELPIQEDSPTAEISESSSTSPKVTPKPDSSSSEDIDEQPTQTVFNSTEQVQEKQEEEAPVEEPEEEEEDEDEDEEDEEEQEDEEEEEEEEEELECEEIEIDGITYYHDESTGNLYDTDSEHVGTFNDGKIVPLSDSDE